MIRPILLEDLPVIIVLKTTNNPSYNHSNWTTTDFLFVSCLSFFDLEEVALPHRFSWNILRMFGNCRCGYNKTGFKDLMSGILTCHVAFLLERNCESIKQHLALIQVVKEKETIDSEQGGHSSRCKTFWNKSSSSRCYEIQKTALRTFGWASHCLYN